MRHPLAAGILALILCAGCGHAPAGPTALLNGKDLSNWELVVPQATDIGAVCQYQPDGSLRIAGQPIGFLATKTNYENYRLHAEWRWDAKPANSGILVNIASGPKDKEWPLSLQVQMKNKAVGDLLPMAGATFAEPFTTPPGANPSFRAHQAADSEKPVGEWNSADIVCRGDTVEVTINGVVQNKATKVSPAAGRVGFQLEGTSYQIRNVQIESLK